MMCHNIFCFYLCESREFRWMCVAGETVLPDNVVVLGGGFSVKGHVCFVCMRAKCQATPLRTYVGVDTYISI